MATPLPIQVRFATPLPVTVRGQVPVTAHSSLPVIEQQWPPPNFFEQYGFWISLVAAGSAIAAAIFSGLAYRLARQELAIVARRGDLRLESHDSKPEVIGATYVWEEDDEVDKYRFQFIAIIKNLGNRAVTDALIFFWLPSMLRPDERSSPLIWRDEERRESVDHPDYRLWSCQLDRRVYPYPFRATQRFQFAFSGSFEERAAFIRLKSCRLYWQLVWDDGRYPDNSVPSALDVILI